METHLESSTAFDKVLLELDQLDLQLDHCATDWPFTLTGGLI